MGKITKFSSGEALKLGWKATKEHFWFFVGVLLIMFAFSIVLGSLGEAAKKVLPIYTAVQILSFIANSLLGMGAINIALKIHNNEEASFADLFSCWPLLLKFIAANILYFLIVLAGLLLLIIPGIIWAVKFQFFSYFVVDKRLGPLEALKKSAIITKGAKLDILIFDILLLGIILLGIFAFLVGLFVAIPVMWLAQAFVYKKLCAYEQI